MPSQALRRGFFILTNSTRRNKMAGKIQNAFGRAFEIWGSLLKITRTIFHPLLNQRGEVGDSDGADPTNPGDDALEHDPPDVAPEGGDDKTPAPSDQEPPADAPGPEPGAEPADKTPADQPPADDKPNEEVVQLTQRIAQMEADLKQANDMAQFYGQFYQDQIQAQQQPGQQQQLGPGQVAEGQPPENIVNPGDWDSQEHTADWVNHTVQSQLQQGYQQMVLPVLQKVTTALQGLQLNSAKAGKEDWDDVYGGTMGEIFTMGPDGKVLGVKNPALLNYFQSQGNPFESMYQYGLTKKTPEKIKQQVQDQTKKTVEKLSKRPKGPTQPKSGETPKDTPALDWDTPAPEAEKILDKKGLI
jgi:hypothetical protein